MKIVRDERMANIAKHSFDFRDLTEEFFSNAITQPAKEGRMQALGVLADAKISVVFAVYGLEGISIISMRPANGRERKLIS